MIWHKQSRDCNNVAKLLLNRNSLLLNRAVTFDFILCAAPLHGTELLDDDAAPALLRG
jgi:hypothetical protein